jgi:ABC-2 type transport system permease protein
VRFAALSYLLRASWRNRVRTQLKRLRRPRYLFALFVGLLYLALIFYRPEGTAATPVYGSVGRSFALVSAFLLAALAAKWWIFGASSGPLAFTNAEVQMLFPAPLLRRDLILYRLFRAQLAMVLSAAFVALLIWRSAGTTRPLALPLRMIGLWLFFAISFMHQMGVTLVRTAAAQRGGGLVRSAPAIIIVTVCVALLGYSMAPAIASIHSINDVSAGFARISAATRQPIPRVILAPFQWVLAPAYANTTQDWLDAVGPAVIILLLHYIWVLRADAVFEDAAVDASARRAARLAARAAALHSGVAPSAPRAPGAVSQSLMRLKAHGPAWSAIVWKNATAAARGLKLVSTVRFGSVIMIVLIIGRQVNFGSTFANTTGVLGMIALIMVVYLTVAGPLTIRNDLRSDLAHLSTLRTYPLRGYTVVFAEILSSAATLTVMQVVLLAAAFGLLNEVTLHERITVLTGALVVLPVVNLVSFTIQNAIALLVPGWVKLGGAVETGQIAFEALGQRALGAIASLIALVVAFIPPFGAAVAITALGRDVASATLGIIVGLVIGGAEVWLAVIWLGGLFERTDAVGVRA